MALSISPNALKRSVAVAIDRASVGGKVTAGYTALRNGIGSGYTIALLRNGTDQATITMVGVLPISGANIVISSSNVSAVSQSTALDLSTGTWTCEIRSAVTSGYKIAGTLGTSGTDFILSASSVPSNTLVLSGITLTLPSSLDSSTYSAVVAINCGGGAFTSGSGRVYLSDVHSTGGSVSSTASAIGLTTDDTVFQSERWGNFTYSIPVTNGTYRVTLQFAEIYSLITAAGLRVFNIVLQYGTAQEQTVQNVDIYAAVGALNAYEIQRTVVVTNGAITIQASAVTQQPKLSAIVVESNAGGTYTPSVIPAPTQTVIWTGDVSIPSTFVGMHVYGLPNNAPYRTKPANPSFPIKFVRSWNYNDAAPQNGGIAWTNIEKSAGVYDWTNLDAWVDYWNVQRGASLMYAHGWWQPTFYSGSTSPLSKGVPQLDKLTSFVREMTLRYRNQIAVQETWNEPNFSGNEGWSGTVTELLSVQKAIYDGVAAARTQLAAIGYTLTTQVCMPAFVDRDPNWGLIQQYVSASYNGVRAKDISDAFSFHLYEFGDGYTSGLENPWSTGYNILKMREVLRDSGSFANWSTIPFYDSEHGFYNAAFQTGTNDAGRATILKRTAVVQAALNTASIFWYAGDDFGSTNIPTGNPVSGFPLQTDSTVGLIGSPLYNSTIAAAFQWMADNLSGKRIVRIERNSGSGALIVTYNTGSQVTV